jgi:hypothetical protein
VTARNNASKIFDISMGRYEIKDDIQNLEAQLDNFKAKIKEKNIRERKEYEEILELQRNPLLAAAR